MLIDRQARIGDRLARSPETGPLTRITMVDAIATKSEHAEARTTAELRRQCGQRQAKMAPVLAVARDGSNLSCLNPAANKVCAAAVDALKIQG